MVYTLVYYVDGGCRGNGQPWAFGAAAAVRQYRYGGTRTWTKRLPSGGHCKHDPTSQRAEITAIILALKLALEKYDSLEGLPKLRLKIFSDSRYAVNCMTDWIYLWPGRDWRNSVGNPVANKGLIQRASRLDDRVRELGTVDYVWVPRSPNKIADEACNRELDKMCDESSDSDY